MRYTIGGWVLAACVMLMAAPALAQTCGGVYTVQRGDSLSWIADRHYQNAGMWTAIHSGNLDQIGEDPDKLLVGMRLTLNCIDGRPKGLEGGIKITNIRHVSAQITANTSLPETPEARAKITLMTGSDYAPFTDRDLPNGGLLADVVNAAMAEADPAQGYAIHWVDGWDSHLEPLLSNALLDMGFPWIRPDCATTPEEYRCANFLFSDPMFEMLTILFTAKDRPIVFETDSDMQGTRLCRPSGYAVHQLDRPDRRWLSDGQVTLVQPRDVSECFDMLVTGAVDGVVLNEFTGRTAIKEMGLTEQVDLAPRPLAVEGLHVLVHKSHPEAEVLLATINAGLRGIKANGTYQQIVDAHLTRIWAAF